MNTLDYSNHDSSHSSIEDGKKFETKPFLPRVSSHDNVNGGSVVVPLAAASSVSYQQRRRRAVSDPNLLELRGGRRRFFGVVVIGVMGIGFPLLDLGLKCLVISGYRLITGFLSLQCYAFLIMPGVLQVAYYYYFSSQIRRDIVFGDQPRNKYKAWGSLLGRHLSGAGVIVACIDYRNYPKATISEMVEDALRGISFVCNNITEYGAGAHIAACALVEQAIKESVAKQTTTWSVSQIKAYFGLSGGYNMFNLAEHLNFRGPYKSLFMRIMGGEESLSKYSPEIVVQDPNNTNAVSILPPVILFHGTADYSIPADCSKTFADSLQRVGVKAELKLYEGKTHTDVFVQCGGPKLGGEVEPLFFGGLGDGVPCPPL
ncbi:hypothetical protein M8C21_027899 [Ambrosia artemisiifolia]|uniref:protein-S-isoprenylcysteine alpha-carbonyl methylesterase n=1 Tax=Ambrosia artemisiifolia TaxID=4212 RepID=A0AAD5CV98_AMBAR|nr:hypothetical protein M8C21_027899 [Ambrosia artemisiifolia]